MRLIDPKIFRTFIAGHVQTKLGSGVTYVSLSESRLSAVEKLTLQNFDFAPVVTKPRDTNVVGWVSLRQLQQSTSEQIVFNSLSNSIIISRESSFTDLLSHLAKTPFVFLAGDDGLQGFIVPSDLDKHAALSHFYLLACGLELVLSELCASQINSQKIIQAIEQGDEKQHKRYLLAISKGIDTSPVSYLYLQSLLRLVSNVPNFYSSLNINQSQWQMDTRRLIALRNVIMHNNLSLTSNEDHDKEPFSPEELAMHAHFIELTIEKLTEKYLL